MKTIKANEGFVFRRRHDGMTMGETISLGIDYSTGVPREDKEEYYEQVEAPAAEDVREGESE